MAEANIFDTDFVYDDGDPDGYHSGDARVGEAAGGKALAVRVFEVPAGQGVCPYHYEYEEEWLVVLEGSVDLRTPVGTRALERGDIVCFPPGPAGAHQVKTQTGAPTARVMMFSSAREPAVAVYPDSDKIGVWPGNKDDDGLFRRADGDVGYWDGEGT